MVDFTVDFVGGSFFKDNGVVFFPFRWVPIGGSFAKNFPVLVIRFGNLRLYQFSVLFLIVLG